MVCLSQRSRQRAPALFWWTSSPPGSDRLAGTDPRSWEHAAAEWDALTRPHRAAYARWREAEALLARSASRVAATDVLRMAANQATQHVPLSNAINDLARRARIDVTHRDELVAIIPTPLPQLELTERELEVLRLVAQGKTNGQIGATLFISTKTASVYVTNILRKLGVTSRVQAAAVAERAGLLATEPR